MANERMGSYRFLTAAMIKWIACLTMLCDHIGNQFLFQYRILSLIGRISFPLFIFLLVEGFTHTRSRTRYFLRLFLFAIISELPFDLGLRLSAYDISRGVITTWEKQNVMWTLLFGFLFMAAYEWAEQIVRGANGRKTGRNPSMTAKPGGRLDQPANAMPRGLLELLLPLMISAPVLVAVIYGAEWMKTDYHGYGVAAIVACFLMKKWSFPEWTAPAAEAFILQSNPVWQTEGYAAFAMPVLFFYNGEKGRSLPKLFFYSFYPAHLIVITLVKMWIGG